MLKGAGLTLRLSAYACTVNPQGGVSMMNIGELLKIANRDDLMAALKQLSQDDDTEFLRTIEYLRRDDADMSLARNEILTLLLGLWMIVRKVGEMHDTRGVVLDHDLFQHTLGVLLRAHGTLEREMNGTAKDTFEVWQMTSDAYDKLVALQK